jgi:hypothetical protein
MPKKREYIAISGYIVDSHLYPKFEQVIAALDDGAMIDHAALSAESTSQPKTALDVSWYDEFLRRDLDDDA